MSEVSSKISSEISSKISSENSLWSEKYRPTTIEDFDAPEYLKNFYKTCLKEKSFPNLLFYGPPGTGKTTFAKILATKCFSGNTSSDNSKDRNLSSSNLSSSNLSSSNLSSSNPSSSNPSSSNPSSSNPPPPSSSPYLSDGGAYVKEFNASDDRGISVIRNEIKNISMTLKKTVIILDECENLTKDSQTCLRRILEDYSETTHFIFCTNYLSKIINPLKSRLLKFKFNPRLIKSDKEKEEEDKEEEEEKKEEEKEEEKEEDKDNISIGINISGKESACASHITYTDELPKNTILHKINKIEGCGLDKKTIKYIFNEICNGDIRRSINLIQGISSIVNNNRSTDGRSMDGRSMDGRSIYGRSMDGRSMDGRSMDGRSIYGRSMDGRSMDGRNVISLINEVAGVIEKEWIVKFNSITINSYQEFIKMFLTTSYSVLQLIHQISEISSEFNKSEFNKFPKFAMVLGECEYKLFKGCSNEIVLNYLCVRKIELTTKYI